MPSIFRLIVTGCPSSAAAGWSAVSEQAGNDKAIAQAISDAMKFRPADKYERFIRRVRQIVLRRRSIPYWSV
jgi:hypothetical protein